MRTYKNPEIICQRFNEEKIFTLSNNTKSSGDAVQQKMDIDESSVYRTKWTDMIE